MAGPLRGAVIGATLLEGWADTPEAAEELAAGGGVRFAANHPEIALIRVRSFAVEPRSSLVPSLMSKGPS